MEESTERKIGCDIDHPPHFVARSYGYQWKSVARQITRVSKAF